MSIEEERDALREENARLTMIADARLKIMEGQGQVIAENARLQAECQACERCQEEVAQLRAHVAALVTALQEVQDSRALFEDNPLCQRIEALLAAPDLATIGVNRVGR